MNAEHAQVQTHGASNNMPNAWVFKSIPETTPKGYSLTIKIEPSVKFNIKTGDALVIATEISGEYVLSEIARVYRVRMTFSSIILLFDGKAAFPNAEKLSEFGISAPQEELFRIEWPIFEKLMDKGYGAPFSTLSVLDGSTPAQQAHLRDLLQWATEDDLLGPADGPEEEVTDMSVRDRYLVGKLAPQDVLIQEDQVEELADTGDADPEGASYEKDASTSQSLLPSSVGMTICVATGVSSFDLHVEWGSYKVHQSARTNKKTGQPFRAWKRSHNQRVETVSLTDDSFEIDLSDDFSNNILVKGAVSDPLANGDRLVTLFLINAQPIPPENQDEAWMFQPQLRVTDPEGRAVFQRRPLIHNVEDDDERIALEMIYRKNVEFAVGHGISVHALPSQSDPELATEISTRVLPEYEIPVTETPGNNDEDRALMRIMISDGSMDMRHLAELDKSDLIETLSRIVNDYSQWITEQGARIGKNVNGYDKPAKEALIRCESIRDRLQEGVEVLETNPTALEAFRFANLVMAEQRVHSVYSLKIRRGEKADLKALNIPKNRSWRPFQLAFVLISIPGLADPGHKDRTNPIDSIADLIWFPTGGGKTEAYLGVAAFTMAMRRLQGTINGFDGTRGLGVIMRYTLRLLTIQQFQRATALICAMEVLRRTDAEKWAETPFSIGLWVGQRVTPNSTDESHTAIEKDRDGQYGTGSTPAQLTFCPWCGSEIKSGRDIKVDKNIGRTFIYCGDKYNQCDFSKTKSPDTGLPVIVVDDELYRHPPSMLIATVDKFAMMAWKGQVRTFFGKATEECARHGLLWPDSDCNGNHQRKGQLPATNKKTILPLRPPDLIIQDEFHLISGPLGTMVGLYETAVDELSSWEYEGKVIRPKIVASTATVRKADEQVNNVFLRTVAIFPPHGLDIEDNYFSVQRSVESKPGRRYLGICSPGSSRPATLIRVYVALLTGAKALFDHFGDAADPYMTLVGYFNSLRELGGMRRLAEDDVNTRSYRVQMSEVYRAGLNQREIHTIDELTSRVSSKDIPQKLDQLEIQYKAKWKRGEARAVDIVLATNMLSVGVDINRLGLMVVNGQPKDTATYIQATSRVGRVFPGLVCTVFAWSRPRDLSHFETFEHYHSTFYKHVEALSVTPFSPRALDRGLTGTMLSVMRNDNEILNPNLGAQELDSSVRPEAKSVRSVLSSRAWKVKSKTAGDIVDKMTADRVDRWVNEAIKGGRKLGYDKERTAGDAAQLLRKPGIKSWDALTVPYSLREVEAGVRLVMDDSSLGTTPDWKDKPRISKDKGGVK